MFNIIIINLDAGSYLCTMPENSLSKAEKKKKDYTVILAWSVDILLIQWSTLQTEYPERRP